MREYGLLVSVAIAGIAALTLLPPVFGDGGISYRSMALRIVTCYLVGVAGCFSLALALGRRRK